MTDDRNISEGRKPMHVNDLLDAFDDIDHWTGDLYVNVPDRLPVRVLAVREQDGAIYLDCNDGDESMTEPLAVEQVLLHSMDPADNDDETF